MGEKLEFSFTVHSLARKEQKLIIDYRVHFVRSQGKTAIKVFKLKNIVMKFGEKLEVKKNHHFCYRLPRSMTVRSQDQTQQELEEAAP